MIQIKLELNQHVSGFTVEVVENSHKRKLDPTKDLYLLPQKLKNYLVLATDCQTSVTALYVLQELRKQERVPSILLSYKKMINSQIYSVTTTDYQILIDLVQKALPKGNQGAGGDMKKDMTGQNKKEQKTICTIL